MAWTYSGDPTTNSKDAVRFLLQDTDQAFQLMQDEEIAYVAGVSTPIYGADDFMTASICADIVASAMAREISISADGVNAGADQLQAKYEQLAKNLRRMRDRIQGVGGVPFVGGVDRFCPPDFSIKALNFGIGFMDNFRAGQQDYGRYGEFEDGYWYGGDGEPYDGGYWTGS
jgi:hypothetical protein